MALSEDEVKAIGKDRADRLLIILKKVPTAGLQEGSDEYIRSAIKDIGEAAKRCDVTGATLQIYGLGSMFGGHAQHIKKHPGVESKEWDANEDIANKVFNIASDTLKESLSEHCGYTLKK
jgi:hypothetical protein